MGMDPFNFADALLGILAQRLAKRLCKCKETYTPTQEEIKHFITEYCGELVNTPEIQKADNDYAVGLVIDKVAHSRFAHDTLIFVLEDDSQDGPDHVDAHRSTAYIVGPYVRHGAVVSTRYTTVNMLRTIEDILGVEHLNLHDGGVHPMADVFDLRRRHWTFAAAPSDILRTSTTLPLPAPLAGRRVRPLKSTHPASWWAERTKGFDFRAEDRIDAQAFNRILSSGLLGDVPYPKRRGAGDARADRD